MKISRNYSATLALAVSVLAGAVGATTISSTAHANLIQDSFFNVPPTPDAGDSYFLNYSTALPGGFWNVLDNNVDVVAPGANPYGMIGPLGGTTCCVVDLVGYGSTGGIYQTVTPILTGLYTLSFDYANNFYSTSTASAAVEVGTTGGGSTDFFVDDVTHSGSSFSNMGWDVFSTSFILTAGTPYTISFDTTFGANSGGVVITDVALNNGMAVGAATPLPTTWALMLSGLALIGFLAFRRVKNGCHEIAAA
jgi:Protein of unknown function (DUF642)